MAPGVNQLLVPRGVHDENAAACNKQTLDAMQIIDAIRRSTSVHEVCFLLTNYVETLQFYAAARHLPDGVTGLPVLGPEDIEERFCKLREAKLCGLARSRCETHYDVFNETTDIFYEGLTRLKALRVAAPLMVAPREDNGLRVLS